MVRRQLQMFRAGRTFGADPRIKAGRDAVPGQDYNASVPVKLLEFTLGAERYGIPVELVASIARAVAITRLPGAPPIVEGAINVRGTLVPVYDVRRRLGASAQPLSPSELLILVWARGRLAAFRADAAEVIAVEDSAIAPASDLARTPPYLSAVTPTTSGLVVIADPGAFLTEAEESSLRAALALVDEPPPA